MTNHCVAQPVVASGDWSQPQDGLRARLVATPHGRDLALAVELENVSDVGNPMETWWDDLDNIMRLELSTVIGPVPPAGVGGSHASAPPFWLELPVGSTLRIPITPNAYEDNPPNKTLFRPVTFQAWDVPPGEMFLAGTIKPPQASDEAGHRAWHGTITLPKITLPSRG
jgi:hypothetical protein